MIFNFFVYSKAVMNTFNIFKFLVLLGILVIVTNLAMIKCFIQSGLYLNITVASFIIFVSNISFGVIINSFFLNNFLRRAD